MRGWLWDDAEVLSRQHERLERWQRLRSDIELLPALSFSTGGGSTAPGMAMRWLRIKIGEFLRHPSRDAIRAT